MTPLGFVFGVVIIIAAAFFAVMVYFQKGL